MLVRKFWDYRHAKFGIADDFFDQPFAPTARPPVFRTEHASINVLLRDGIPELEGAKVLSTMPVGSRHKWFRSMASSQALTQSVFGNLIAHEKLSCLSTLVGDDGKPLFIRDPSHSSQCQLEFEVDYLAEKSRGRTSVDVLFNGSYRIAVECKLSEAEVGSCSRPRLRPSEPSFAAQFCDGRYAVQRGRSSPCSLTEFEVKYWKYIPLILNWSAEKDHDPCPLNSTYQLVRNLLAVCVDRTGRVSLDSGHVVLLYDERNPAFQAEGDGITAWKKVRAALKKPTLMQMCAWQEIVSCLRTDESLNWLTYELGEKYGF